MPSKRCRPWRWVAHNSPKTHSSHQQTSGTNVKISFGHAKWQGQVSTTCNRNFSEASTNLPSMQPPATATSRKLRRTCAPSLLKILTRSVDFPSLFLSGQRMEMSPVVEMSQSCCRQASLLVRRATRQRDCGACHGLELTASDARES